MNTIVEQLFNIPEAWYERTLYMARDSQMTYGNVRHLMLQTAAWLAEIHRVKPGQQVALCLPMGMTAAQVVLGVLASGASYLPLQFAGPSERLLEILADSDSVLLLTTKTMAKKLNNALSAKGPVPVVTIDPAFIAFSGILERITHLGRPIPADPEQPAAVFFTSGSTGQPKGIMMSRASMTATSFILAENMIVRAEDRMIMMAPLHYASSLGLFFPIPAGCSTYIVSEEEAMFPQVVAEILEREHISMWIGAATRLRLLAESGGLDCRDCSSVRYVEFFGEPMPIQSLHRAMRCFSNAKFQNTYGSSEAFWMSRFPVSDDLPAHLEALPIGKPLPCYEFFLCDENENTVSAGDVGEICVVGPVALTGYWKRPDLSAAARLNGISNSYRTGDLARLGADGNYHFVGRRDHQVKIRGHRFELGEIETVLRSHSSVRDAIAFLDGQEIRACVLAENRAGLTSEIRAICAQRLPVFARPKHVAVLDQFPQLASGKVDRIALQKTSEIWELH